MTVVAQHVTAQGSAILAHRTGIGGGRRGIIDDTNRQGTDALGGISLHIGHIDGKAVLRRAACVVGGGRQGVAIAHRTGLAIIALDRQGPVDAGHLDRGRGAGLELGQGDGGAAQGKARQAVRRTQRKGAIVGQSGAVGIDQTRFLDLAIDAVPAITEPRH